MRPKLSDTKRHRRVLHLSPRLARGNVKTSYEGWIQWAKVVLIEEGIGRVKIYRLAQRLKVTRGGFYHHFDGLQDLLQALLNTWRGQNRFIDELGESPRTSQA